MTEIDLKGQIVELPVDHVHIYRLKKKTPMIVGETIKKEKKNRVRGRDLEKSRDRA